MRSPVPAETSSYFYEMCQYVEHALITKGDLDRVGDRK